MDNIQRNIENQDCDPDRVLWRDLRPSSLLDRAMAVYVGLDVIFATGLELNKEGESGCFCLAEDTTVVYDYPERDSEISSRSSTPGRDGSVTPLGMGEEACNVVDDDDFTGIEVGRLDIYE